MPNQTPEGYNRPLPGKPDPWSPYDIKFDGFWKGGKHWSEVVADDAVDYIGEAKQDKRPFFMYIAFNAPHDPRQAPKEYIDRYPLSRIKVPAATSMSILTRTTSAAAPGCATKNLGRSRAPTTR